MNSSYEFLIVHSFRGYTAVDAEDGSTICTMESEQILLAFMKSLNWKHRKLYAEPISTPVL